MTDEPTDDGRAPLVPLLGGDEQTDQVQWRHNPLERELQRDAE